MMKRYLMTVVTFCCVLSVSAAADKDLAKLNEKALKMWGTSPIVAVGELTESQAGPVSLSRPPIYTYRVKIKVGEALRGSMKKGEEIQAYYRKQQMNAPVMPVGKKCLFAMKHVRKMWQISEIAEATKIVLEEAELACSVPLGWTFVKGKLVSPWAALGEKAWPSDPKGARTCSTTGRPTLLVGEDVEMTLEVVPPVKKLKYGNPDGDGKFKITLTNVSKQDVSVPALLSDGKKILWADSLVVLCQDKAYPIPTTKGVTGKTQPTLLKAGQSVSTVVNVFQLEGPKWPRGGYRLEFQICLGEKGVAKSFYYLSKHHDPIRDATLKESKKD